MNWKLKALVQRAVALLPRRVGDAVYFRLQRHFGGLRDPEPTTRLEAAAGVARRLEEHDRSLAGARVLEVGTGWRLNVPIGLWLCGAGEVVTVDLNPYLQEELVREDLRFFREASEQVLHILGEHGDTRGLPGRLSRLRECRTLDEVLDLAGIRYRAPADARRLSDPPDRFDAHVSYTVLEHVPPEVIRGILAEGKRVLKPHGLFVHKIDFSDHFAHSDDSIHTTHFLRYDDPTWRLWAGNRFAYHNRLRVHEMEALFAEAGLQLLERETLVDRDARARLERREAPLHPRFDDAPAELVATRNAWFVAGATNAAEHFRHPG